MKKIINIILFVLSLIGFIISFGLALHMKWFFAIPTTLGVLSLGLCAIPTIKDLYNNIFGLNE